MRGEGRRGRERRTVRRHHDGTGGNERRGRQETRMAASNALAYTPRDNTEAARHEKRKRERHHIRTANRITR